jgi:glycosyltransferase involved in cell wall biosynthesis
MRVLHWYPNLIGGGSVTKATLLLAEAQSRLGATVCVSASTGDRDALYGLEIPESLKLALWEPSFRLQFGGLALRGLRRMDARDVRAFGPDVVHVQAEFNPDNLRVPRLFHCPVVLAPRGAFNAPVFAKSSTRSKLAYVWAARRLLYRHIASFHALSPDEAVHVRQLLPGAAVYVAPDPIVDAPPPGALGRRRPVDDTVRLIFVGRLDVFTKGLDLLLNAVAMARSELLPTRVQLTLVGPDWHDGRRRLERLARDLAVSESIRFSGVVSPAQVDVLLSGSDLYVQLSRHEAFGLSIREALLAPLPVVVTEGAGIASFPEISCLPHVITVQPLDAVAAAASIVGAVRRLPELRAHAEQARPRVLNFFSWRSVAEMHAAAYSTLRRNE